MADRLKEFITDSKALVRKDAPDVPQGVRVADWGSIQKFCVALGDVNPLYNDAAGGVGTLYNTMIAPPTFILAVRTPNSGAAHEAKDYGLRKFTTSASAEWNDVIHLGERLVSDLKVKAVRNGKKWGSRSTAEVESTATYRTLYGGVLATATGVSAMVPYNPGESFLDDREIYRYSDEEIHRIERDLDAIPKHRGKVPLYWSEVHEGAKLPPLVKGPLGHNELTAWVVAEAKPTSVALGAVLHRMVKDSPGRLTVNPSTQWPYFDVEQTYNDLLSVQALGFKLPVARGVLQFALAAQAITNWMGDLGFLRRLSLNLPNRFFYGDTMWVTGEVVRKYKETVGSEDYHAVEIRLAGNNQRGEVLVDGMAVAYLPERGFLVGLPIGNPW